MGTAQGVDKILVRLMQGENPAKRSLAWQKWYDKDSPKLTKYVFSRIRNRQLCEEIVHDAFVIGFKKVSDKKLYQYKGKSLLAYLYRTAKNLIAQRLSERLMASLTTPDGKEIEILIPSKEEDINSEIDRDEVLRRLPEAMAQLSARQKTILTKRYIEDKSMDQVAVELGITRNLVGVETNRATKKLKILLGVYYY